MAVFAAVDPRFLKPLNLFNVMRQVSIYGLLAIGMTFVILTRGIDLSVGSVVALAGLGAAMVAKGGLRAASPSAPRPRRMAGAGRWRCSPPALIGTACGWLQGLAITKLKVPPFVVTLGGMSAFRGLALYMAGGGPISGFDEAYRWWGQGYVGPVPVPVIIFLAFARARPPRPDLDPLRPQRLRRRRQSRGRPPVRPRRRPDHHLGLRHHRLHGRPRRLRPLRPPQLRRGRRRPHLRAHRHRLGGHRRHLACSAASAPSSAPSSARS